MAAKSIVDLKLKNALERKMKVEEDRLRKLQEKIQKAEERHKIAEEAAAVKRKREEKKRREREEKRMKRLEEVRKQQKEAEEQQRLEIREKEHRHKALVEYERKKREMEEETKKKRRVEKEKEAAERRRRLAEDVSKSTKFVSKDSNHSEEVVTFSCKDVKQSILSSETTSYETTSDEGFEEEDNYDDFGPGKVIQSWTRKENLIPLLLSQQYIDPDELFAGSKTVNLDEVFKSYGSNITRDFKRRSYSGEWVNDRLTEEEEYLYKLQMGYI